MCRVPPSSTCLSADHSTSGGQAQHQGGEVGDEDDADGSPAGLSETGQGAAAAATGHCKQVTNQRRRATDTSVKQRSQPTDPSSSGHQQHSDAASSGHQQHTDPENQHRSRPTDPSSSGHQHHSDTARSGHQHSDTASSGYQPDTDPAMVRPGDDSSKGQSFSESHDTGWV